MKRTFDNFMVAVNVEINKACGLDYDDLPDYRYADDYADGFSPKQTANHALNYADTF